MPDPIHPPAADALTDSAVVEDLFRKQGEALQAIFAAFQPTAETPAPDPTELQHWAMSVAKLQKMWLDFGAEQAGHMEPAMARMADPARWSALVGEWFAAAPMARARTAMAAWEEGVALWSRVLGSYRTGVPADPSALPDLPRKDRQFSDPRWREQPWFALIHQAYLLAAEQLTRMADDMPSMPGARQDQLRMATRLLIEAMSPANFPLSNPEVIDRTLATRGENLVVGVEHMLADIRRGQLTHTDPTAFEVGRNIAATPGKVVLTTPVFELIQYTPVTAEVLATPLVIFPPWVNRYYILDLNARNSFIRWAVEQGITVFVASWKSADATMADMTWDDYVLAQLTAIDAVRARLDVPAVHTIGFCVAGTTLAATLALLARRGEADKVVSATFFAAQVDFELAGDLRVFVDDAQLKLLDGLASDGYLDGRYMAAAFNLMRSKDLVWSTVVSNYLLGQPYPAFDLLHWNSDTTNLPFGWLKSFLQDIYRDNRLVMPDALSIDGTPIDLRRIATPCYIQAGREDHIAPAKSVWRMTRHLSGPWRFVLAGSGHIAGVVNPPAAGKYQFWRNDNQDVATLEAFIAGARETKGSWWPDWAEWLAAFDPRRVPADGPRVPGGKGEEGLIDAPGRYVRMR